MWVYILDFIIRLRILRMSIEKIFKNLYSLSEFQSRMRVFWKIDCSTEKYEEWKWELFVSLKTYILYLNFRFAFYYFSM